MPETYTISFPPNEELVGQVSWSTDDVWTTITSVGQVTATIYSNCTVDITATYYARPLGTEEAPTLKTLKLEIHVLPYLAGKQMVTPSQYSSFDIDGCSMGACTHNWSLRNNNNGTIYPSGSDAGMDWSPAPTSTTTQICVSMVCVVFHWCRALLLRTGNL